MTVSVQVNQYADIYTMCISIVMLNVYHCCFV